MPELEPKYLNIGVGAGAKDFRCLEPKIWNLSSGSTALAWSMVIVMLGISSFCLTMLTVSCTFIEHVFTEMSSRSSKCPVGYNQMFPYCYKVFKKTSYQYAKSVCSRAGATLPVVRNREMHQYLQEIMQQRNLGKSWLGLQASNPGSNQVLVWDVGIPFNATNFEIQGRNRTSSGNPRLCHIVRAEKKNIKRYSCNATNPFICIRWQEVVKPVEITNDVSIQRNDRVYIPLYGVLCGGAPFYVQNTSRILSHSLYSYVTQGLNNCYEFVLFTK